MGNSLNCDAVDMQDTVSRYVSGQLAEEDAAAFEQHLEGCERCWGEVQVALQVRAATRLSGEYGAEPQRSVASYRRRWWVAAAASVVIALSGWWVLDQRETPVEVMRGGNGIVIAASRLPDGGLRLSWPAVDGASRYRVLVSAADGTLLVTRETDRVELTLAPADLPTPMPATLLVELRAEDALGTTLVAHGPASLPIPADRP